jgi:hypothetical protein
MLNWKCCKQSLQLTFMVQAVFSNLTGSGDSHLATYTIKLHVAKIEGPLIAQQSQNGNCLLMDSIHSKEVDDTVLGVATELRRVCGRGIAFRHYHRSLAKVLGRTFVMVQLYHTNY